MTYEVLRQVNILEKRFQYPMTAEVLIISWRAMRIITTFVTDKYNCRTRYFECAVLKVSSIFVNIVLRNRFISDMHHSSREWSQLCPRS